MPRSLRHSGAAASADVLVVAPPTRAEARRPTAARPRLVVLFMVLCSLCWFLGWISVVVETRTRTSTPGLHQAGCGARHPRSASVEPVRDLVSTSWVGI